jgi:hypothetical protein
MMRHYLDHNATVREGAQTKTGRPSVLCCLSVGEAIK